MVEIWNNQVVIGQSHLASELNVRSPRQKLMSQAEPKRAAAAKKQAPLALIVFRRQIVSCQALPFRPYHAV